MYCIRCGTQMPQGAIYCQSCGLKAGDDAGPEVLTATPPPLPPRTPGVDPHDASQAKQASAEPARYAGFWRRVGASVVDGLVQSGIAIVFMIVLVVVVGTGNGNEATVGALYYLGSLVIGWLYFSLTQSSARMATFGKRAMGVKVVTLAGERISFTRATGRYFAYVFVSCLLTFGIGLLMAGFTSRKQAIHDMIAGTLVVSKNTTAEDIASGLHSPKASVAVIALAVLAGLVPIVGIVAAIALPAYQDYTVRTQVAAGLNAASSYKAGVADAYASGTPFDQITNDIVGLGTDAGSPYVDTIEVTSGAVVITYGDQANRLIAGKTLVLVPGSNDAGDVIWTCGRASVPEGVAPAFHEHEQYTDVEDKYLPSACR